jgi:hypothetical protein
VRRLELRNVAANYPFERAQDLRGSSRILATETIRVRAAALGIRSSGLILPSQQAFCAALAIERHGCKARIAAISADPTMPDNGYRVKDARAATIEPDEQSTIGPTQMRSAWRSLLQDIELMPQYHYLGFQLLSRLEAVAQHAD